MLTLRLHESAHCGQIVAQVIEAQLAVGHICDIALVGRLPALVLRMTDESPQNLRRRCILTPIDCPDLEQQVPACTSAHHCWRLHRPKGKGNSSEQLEPHEVRLRTDYMMP